jgi:hypothetical protein
MHPQAIGRGLKEQQVAFAPVAPVEQRGCLGWRHPKSSPDSGWRRDASVLQLALNHDAEANPHELVSLSGPALLGS